MSRSLMQTDRSEQQYLATINQALTNTLKRIRRKANVIIVGAVLVFAGQLLAADAGQSWWQRTVETATFGLLLILVFFAWHIKKDVNDRT